VHSLFSERGSITSRPEPRGLLHVL
jgi:hypothetical protein